MRDVWKTPWKNSHFTKTSPRISRFFPFFVGHIPVGQDPSISEVFFGVLSIFFFYPSGKRLHCELERSTMPFNGKIHYFDWAMASIANC